MWGQEEGPRTTCIGNGWMVFAVPHRTFINQRLAHGHWLFSHRIYICLQWEWAVVSGYCIAECLLHLLLFHPTHSQAIQCSLSVCSTQCNLSVCSTQCNLSVCSTHSQAIQCTLSVCSTHSQGVQHTLHTHKLFSVCRLAEGIRGLLRTHTHAGLPLRNFLSWKELFIDDLRLKRNWRRGRCVTNILQGHTKK